MIKCIGIDIDGTLLKEGSTKSIEISRENIDALKEFCERGGSIVLATGRNIRRTQDVVERLIAEGVPRLSIPYLICLNGASIIDLGSGHVISERHFDERIVRRTTDFFMRKKVNIFLFNSNNEMFHQIKFFSYLIYFTIFRKKCKRRILKFNTDVGNIQKVMVVLKWPWIRKLQRELLSKFKNGDFYCSKGSKFFLEIIDHKINKFFAIKEVASLLRISTSEVAFIGNEQNDVMSLENVGYGYGVDLYKKGDDITWNKERITRHVENDEGTAVALAIQKMKEEELF